MVNMPSVPLGPSRQEQFKVQPFPSSAPKQKLNREFLCIVAQGPIGNLNRINNTHVYLLMHTPFRFYQIHRFYITTHCLGLGLNVMIPTLLITSSLWCCFEATCSWRWYGRHMHIWASSSFGLIIRPLRKANHSYFKVGHKVIFMIMENGNFNSHHTSWAHTIS